MAAALTGLVFIGTPGCRKDPSPGPAVKHAILFIGDGMSLPSEVAASRYLYGKDHSLAWNVFPIESFVATWDIGCYNRNAKQAGRPEFSMGAFLPSLGYDVRLEGRVPSVFRNPGERGELPPAVRPSTESAAAATAMSAGFKTESGNVAWLSGVAREGPLRTLIDAIREERRGAVGVVSTVPFNHATPAAFAAHNDSRSHYYTGYRGYKGQGLADEMILSVKPDVVIGGGHPAYNNPDFDPRKGYISENLMENLRASSEYIFVERKSGVDGGRALAAGVDDAVRGGKKLFGLFGGEDGSFESPIPEDNPGAPAVGRATEENPSFKEAVLGALRILSLNPEGFFLVAEEGDIDWANHNNDFGRMIGAMAELEESVRAAVEFVDNPGDGVDWTNTILVVTADHATGFLRLNHDKSLGKGDLPQQIERKAFESGVNPAAAMGKPVFVSPYVYPDGEVSYGTLGHTNELVTLSARGRNYRIFLDYKGLWYAGPIMDNTQVNIALRKVLGVRPPGRATPAPGR